MGPISNPQRKSRVKRIRWLAGSLLVVSLALAGCGDGDVDTSKLEDSFSSSQPARKSAVDNVVSAIKSEDYAKASAALGRLAASTNLTAEQKKAIQDLASQLREKITQTAKEAAKDGGKAIEDMQKRLNK
jgi:acyl-CoA reductase-like NAD-dependent aldehyde dehydrogenase